MNTPDVTRLNQKSAIPNNLEKINTENIFEATIYPLTKKQFFDKYYQKKAVVIAAQPEGRFDTVIKEQLFGLDLY